MIIPKKVLIKNFLSIGEAEIDLCDQGLVSIQGVNADDPSADSNGSGKSSLVDAVSWCLYGQTARGVTGDSVVNIQQGRGTFVEVEVEIDGDTYHIMRGRKHSKLKNRVQIRQGTRDLTLGTDKLTQGRINALMGCSVDVFNAAIYMGQENMPDLPAMTDKALKAVLEEALSLNRLDDALTIANDRIAEVETKRHSARAALDACSLAVGNLAHEITASETVIEDMSKQAHDMGMTIEDERHDIKRQISEMSKDIQADRDALIALGDLPDPIERAHDRTAKEHAPLVAKANRLMGEGISIVREIADVERALEADDVCDGCGRPLDNHADHRDQLETKLKALRQKAIKAERAHNEAIEHANAVSAMIDAEFKAASQDANKASELRARIKSNTQSLQTMKASWATRYKRMTETLRGRLQTIELRKERHDKLLESHRVASSEVVRHQKALTDLEEQLEVLGKVKYALGRKGFRGEVLDHVTPYLNTRTGHYLNALTGGAITAVWDTVSENSAGDYTENFHIKVAHVSGVDRFQLLSGGEKRKVRLACALALQDLVATRAVKPIKLFIADEIDDAIDAAGLELLMGVLEVKAREMGTVFIISHNPLADWVRNTLTVTKRDGVSTFETH